MRIFIKKYFSLSFLFLAIILFGCNNKKDLQLKNSIFFNGNHQNVCWLLTESVNETDSSKRYILNLISIPEEKILAKCFVDYKKILPYFVESKNHQINLVGDRVWTILPDSNIEARNILTGEVCETNQSLCIKFPKMKDKAKEVKMYSLDPLGFYMKDMNSNEYFYEISSSVLYDKNQWNIYHDSIQKFTDTSAIEKKIIFKKNFEKIVSNPQTKKIELIDLKNGKMVQLSLPKNISINNLIGNYFIVFFQNEIQIQDKNSAKFAFSINPVSGKLIWQERADSIFNRMLRNKIK